MTQITFQDQIFDIAEEQDLLAGLLSGGIEIPYGCRSGVCQSCLVKSTGGTVPASAQVGLSDMLKVQGYFLACQCYPLDGMGIELPSADERCYSSHILAKQWLSEDVVQLKLSMPKKFSFRAGQFVTLWRDDRLGRSYSMANLPGSEYLEFHIRKVPGGQFSGWAAEDAKVGDAIEIQGPAGECCYLPSDLSADLMLIGTGTGLAPLQGILQDAIQSNHSGAIHLFHGALTLQGLYGGDLLSRLERENENFHYHPCVLSMQESESSALDVEVGDLSEIVFHQSPSMEGKRVYLCGDPDLVNKLKVESFLAGASNLDIYADAFEPSRA